MSLIQGCLARLVSKHSGLETSLVSVWPAWLSLTRLSNLSSKASRQGLVARTQQRRLYSLTVRPELSESLNAQHGFPEH